MRIDDIDDHHHHCDDDQELEEAEERSKMAEDQIEGMRRVRGSSVLVSIMMMSCVIYLYMGQIYIMLTQICEE